jgi:hypothetical protein
MGMLQSTYAIGRAFSTAAYLILFDAMNDDQAWGYLFLLGILPAGAAFFLCLRTTDRVKTGATEGAKISFPLLFTPEIRRTSILATLFGVGGQGTYYSVFVFLPTLLVEERVQTVVGTATYSWVVIAGSFIGYVLAGFIHDAIGRRPAFTLYSWLGFRDLRVRADTDQRQLHDLHGQLLPRLPCLRPGCRLRLVPGRAVPSNMRAAGQGLAYNVGRGLAALGPGFACALAITCGVAAFRDLRQGDRRGGRGVPSPARLAGVTG